MRHLILPIIFISLLPILGCEDTPKEPQPQVKLETKQKEASNSLVDFSISECIHNALYYLETTDIKTYDSLDTRYFHEIMGYRNNTAIKLEEKIISIKQNIVLDTMHNLSSIVRDEMQLQIDSLRNELNFYNKEVIGYVFVHTYTSLSDTLSAIIIMNNNCSSSQAIPVQTIKNIDPKDYVYRVHQINEKEI